LTRSGRASRLRPGAPPDAAPARAARPLGHLDGLRREDRLLPLPRAPAGLPARRTRR